MSHLIKMAFLASFLFFCSCTNYSEWEEPLPEGAIVSDTSLIEDPLERFNRFSFGVNEGLMKYVVEPTSDGYQYLMPKTGREGLRNFYRNILYPVSLVNNILQWKWNAVRTETYRFGINTTVGFLGFSDAAKDDFDIRADTEDLGLTFAAWGWDSKYYLHLPIFGPTSERDGLGLVGDYFLNPITYIHSPTNTWVNGSFIFNNMSFFTDAIRQLRETNYDRYELVKLIYTIARKNQVDNFSMEAEDSTSTQTLRAVFLAARDPDFVGDMKERSLTIDDTKLKLEYNYRLQDKPAPVMYVIPGLGSHRKSGQPMALAEMAFEQGYSVVTFSSLMNWEPILKSKNATYPGYTPKDIDNLTKWIRFIDQDLNEHYSDQLGKRSVMGVSLGAYYLLHMAARENEPGAMKFENYVAIDSPVDLMYGLKQLDKLYDAPSAYPAEERKAKTLGILLKVAALVKNREELNPSQPLPFNDIEASYLIGLSFRSTLRDMLFISKYQNELINRGTFAPRREIYKELMQYSYQDYYSQFVIPHLAKQGIAEETVLKNIDLRTHTDALIANKKIKILINRNDFLINKERIAWFKSTFGENLTLFEEGGHLGNLNEPEVREKIFEAMKIAE